VKLGYIRPADVGHTQSSESRQDEASQVAPILLRRALLHPHRDVLAVEPLRQLADGDRLAAFLAHLSRVTATPHVGQRLDGTGTCLIDGQDAVWPERQLPGACADAVLDQVALPPGRHYPHSEAGYVAIPQHVLGRPHLGCLHHPLRQSAQPILLLPAHRSVWFAAALRKQEAARPSEKLRGSVRGMCPAQSTKPLKTAERRELSVVPGSTCHGTNNLKVTGSNPVPATNKTHLIKYLPHPAPHPRRRAFRVRKHRGSKKESTSA
jgi:hypothetical protein